MGICSAQKKNNSRSEQNNPSQPLLPKKKTQQNTPLEHSNMIAARTTATYICTQRKHCMNRADNPAMEYNDRIYHRKILNYIDIHPVACNSLALDHSLFDILEHHTHHPSNLSNKSMHHQQILFFFFFFFKKSSIILTNLE